MRVYQFAVQPGYEWVVPVERRDFEILGALDGSSKGDAWTPPRVEILRTDESGKRLAESDFPWLGSHAPVFRQKALDAVGHLFLPEGEFLPLACDSADLQVLNVLRVIDALDLERSELGRLPNNQIIRVKRHVFVSEHIQGARVFKIPQLPLQAVYVTGEIAKAIERSGLRGVGFRQVWEEMPKPAVPGLER